MLCIGTGAAVNDANRMRFENDQFYMKTEEEMREALKDFPEACDTTVEVAEKVRRGAGARLHPAALPACPRARPRKATSASACRRAWSSTTATLLPAARRRKRADYEMGIIIQQGFPGVLPHRAGVHRMGAQPGHRRGPGPRLGRRRHRGVRHGHHRP